jgi:hypothetical protein
MICHHAPTAVCPREQQQVIHDLEASCQEEGHLPPVIGGQVPGSPAVAVVSVWVTQVIIREC